METPKTEQHRQMAAEMREARAKASDHRMTRAEFVAQSTTESTTLPYSWPESHYGFSPGLPDGDHLTKYGQDRQ